MASSMFSESCSSNTKSKSSMKLQEEAIATMVCSVNCEHFRCNFFSLVQFVTNQTTSSSEIFEEKASNHISLHVKENDTRELHLASAYMDMLEISLGSTGGVRSIESKNKFSSVRGNSTSATIESSPIRLE